MNKLIISALLMVGLVGMIGWAAAYESIDVYEPGTEDNVDPFSLVPDGSGIIKDLYISNMDDTPVNVAHEITYDVIIEYNPGTATTSDIELKFLESGGLWGPAPFDWTQDADTKAETLNVEFKAKSGAPSDAEYLIRIWDGPDYAEAMVSVKAVTVPEFPTVALPIAAILGLMFIISSRKKKE